MMKTHLAACAWLSVATLSAWADQVTVDCPLRIVRTDTNVAVFWQLPAECSTNLVLQSAADLSGPWSTIPGATDPFVPPTSMTQQVFRPALMLPTGCSNALQIAHLIRTFAFSANTNLNPATEFDIQIEPIRDLWDSLAVQVMIVREAVRGGEFNRFACIIHDGTVRAIGQSIGGYGLMSGLVQGQSFYFTYSFGSGVHRSHVGKLQIENGEVKVWDTGGFVNQDLFLRRTNTAVTVESGRFESFNGWQDLGDFGWIDESDPAATTLVGTNGNVLAVFSPVSP
jgi:hypothetical protein